MMSSASQTSVFRAVFRQIRGLNRAPGKTFALSRNLSTSSRLLEGEKKSNKSSLNTSIEPLADKETALKSREYFEEVKEKNKKTFRNAIDIFNKRGEHKRGAVEFILAALKNMEAYGVHRDLEVYRDLMDVFPKGKYIPETMWAAEFAHYPKQQDCAVRILTYMERNDVIPDKGELGSMTFSRVGRIVLSCIFFD